MFKRSMIALAAVMCFSSVASAAEGTLFYNSNNRQAVIVSETVWPDGGGFDAVVDISDYGMDTFREVYGVACSGNDPYDGYIAQVENGRVVDRYDVVAYSGNYSGRLGYFNDLWHNVCLNDNRY